MSHDPGFHNLLRRTGCTAIGRIAYIVPANRYLTVQLQQGQTSFVLKKQFDLKTTTERADQSRTAIFAIAQIVRSIESSSPIGSLDRTSRSILSYIGEAEVDGVPLRACDIIACPGFGTPPTVYSSLSSLEEAGLISRTEDSGDRRSNLIRLTPRAHRIYARVSSRITEYFAGPSGQSAAKG